MKLLSLSRTRLAALAVVTSFVLFSCQKEKGGSTTQPVSEQDAAVYSEESVQTEASFDDVEDVSMIAASEESEASAPNGRLLPFEELKLRIGLCATIDVSPNDSTYPKTITIDFGNGCECADGKFRKGAIIINLTGPVRRPGSVMTITLRDFYLSRAHIEGTKTISNLGEIGHIKFTVQVTGGKITYPNGRGYSYEKLMYVNQVAGGDTKTCRDDVYHIEGRSKTEFANGVSIVLNTETALVKKVSCPWITDGKLKITINDRVLFLDFGAPDSAGCDNKAMLTWNNGEGKKLISLP